MPLLLRYVLETGAITGVWESTELDVLEAQRVTDDPVYGYLLTLLPLAASTVEQDYEVVDGALVARSSPSPEKSVQCPS
jgi:hypothetical protein